MVQSRSLFVHGHLLSALPASMSERGGSFFRRIPLFMHKAIDPRISRTRFLGILTSRAISLVPTPCIMRSNTSRQAGRSSWRISPCDSRNHSLAPWLPGSLAPWRRLFESHFDVSET